MTSSSTYAYAPEIAEFVDEAFERCEIDPADVAVPHLRSARRSLNLMFSDWATKGVLLFAVDEQTQTVTQSLASYTAATGTLAILDGIIRRSGIDTQVFRMSRENYHLIPDKTQEGLPGWVYFDLKTGDYKLWNVPENSTDVFRYNRLRRLQDVTAGQQTPDVPYHWYEALASGLAQRLSLKYKPEKYALLKSEAVEKLASAMLMQVEHTDTAFTIGG